MRPGLLSFVDLKSGLKVFAKDLRNRNWAFSGADVASGPDGLVSDRLEICRVI